MCSNHPTIALESALSGVWWVVWVHPRWPGGKVGRILAMEIPVPHLGLHRLAV